MIDAASVPSYAFPPHEKRARHDQRRPDPVEDRCGALWRHGKRMPAEHQLVILRRLDRRLDTGEGIDRLEHAIARRQPAHRLAAVKVVPDLSVVRARLLEKPDRGG